MNVSLTPELEEWVQTKVATGLYTSASEVIREALRELHRKETSSVPNLSDLLQVIDLGIDPVEGVAVEEWTDPEPSVNSEVKEQGGKRPRK